MVLTELVSLLPFSFLARTLIMILGLAWCGLFVSYVLHRPLNRLLGRPRLGIRRFFFLIVLPLAIATVLVLTLAALFPITLPWDNYEKNLISPIYDIDVISPLGIYLILAALYLIYLFSGRLNGFFGFTEPKRRKLATLKQFSKSQFFLIGLGLIILFLALKLFLLRGAYGNFLAILGMLSGVSFIHFGSEKREGR